MRFKYALITLVTALVLLLVWAGVSSYDENARLAVLVAPDGSRLTLNGHGIRSGVSRVRPGSYTLSASHSGFASDSHKVTIKAREERFIGFSLKSNSPATADWYKNHPADNKLLESISSQTVDQISKDQVNSLPLIKDLPFVDQFYRIDYGPSLKYPKDPTKTALYVKYYSQEGKQQADQWLKFKGYDPTRLEIYYKPA